jgi:DNA-binding transcriptional ArsR family regulator
MSVDLRLNRRVHGSARGLAGHCGKRNSVVTLPGVDEVASAIADPVRREILLMLRDESLSAGQIAGRFPISRPAISRHLRVLREAGLVHDAADGRRRVYMLVTAPLDALAGWLGQLTGPSGWQHQLDALETEVYRTRRERKAAEARPTVAHTDHQGSDTSAARPLRQETGRDQIQKETA